MWTAVLIALTSAGLAADMEPGALRRPLDDIYLHRRKRGSILSAVHEHVSPNLAETQPMSVEICFRLNIWPLQQLSALLEYFFYSTWTHEMPASISYTKSIYCSG